MMRAQIPSQLLLPLAAVACVAGSAQAAVTISTAATQNMNCANGICTPTATTANLNVTELENDLASGNLTVTTTGSGVETTDIAINAGIAWTSTNTLSLKAYRSIAVNQPIAVNGASGLAIVTNNGGSGGAFSFASGANASFLDLSSALTINGVTYALEDSVKSLASAVAANPSGNYALANNYDASKDGTYNKSPIKTEFAGNFEGLGNTISNVSINISASRNFKYYGLFSELGSGNQPGGMIENIVLTNLNIAGNAYGAVGGLVGVTLGTINGAFVSGSVESTKAVEAGELVGTNTGTIDRSGVSGTVASPDSHASVGGLAGDSTGTITESYANCIVSAGESSGVGGLVGGNSGSISRSYAMGTARGANGSYVGGLAGDNGQQGMTAQSYSTTATFLHNRTGGKRGGLIGIDYSPAGSNANDDWDTTTSGVVNLAKGAGSPKNDPGITGLTSQQLQSGLPNGFDPTIWAENPNINGGFPYLIANPPR